MSNVIRISPHFTSLQRTTTLCIIGISYNNRLLLSKNFSALAAPLSTTSLVTSCTGYTQKIHPIGRHIKALTDYGEEGPLETLDSLPVSIQLEPISSETQFDQVISEAQRLKESIVIVWMASWCRKCIYLKPKLEKLAADYYPRTRFYCVDVNTVPYKLVVRAEVTKMPTIQLWNDGKKQGEVIGGHKAYLVVHEVRSMIENEDAT